MPGERYLITGLSGGRDEWNRRFNSVGGHVEEGLLTLTFGTARPNLSIKVSTVFRPADVSCVSMKRFVLS